MSRLLEAEITDSVVFANGSTVLKKSGKMQVRDFDLLNINNPYFYSYYYKVIFNTGHMDKHTGGQV